MSQTTVTVSPSPRARKGARVFAGVNGLGAGSPQLPGRVQITQWVGEPHADIANFMRLYGYTGARDFGRRCSEGTYTNRKAYLTKVFKTLAERNRGVRTLSQLTPRYMPDLLKVWNERDMSGTRTMQVSSQIQVYSILSWFWRVHGIEVKPFNTYAESDEEKKAFRRSFVAQRDKSWEAAGVDFDEVYQRAMKMDPVVARLLLLGKNFGMRINEALRLKPVDNDAGDRLKITDGAKGGRPREIPYAGFGEAELRAVIEEVKEQLSPGQHAAWQGRSLKAARKHMYHMLGRLGLTKKQLGVTFHGLRTQWAIEQFERLTGAAAPVRGGSSLNYREFAEHRRAISQAMGHNRISVTSAYFGSFFQMRAPAEMRFRESWRLLHPKLSDIHEVLNRRGVKNLWWVGRRSSGANTGTAEDWELLVDDATTPQDFKAVADDLCTLLESDLGIVRVLHSAAASEADKQRWHSGALPLFEVTAPQMKLLNPPAMEAANTRES